MAVAAMASENTRRRVKRDLLETWLTRNQVIDMLGVSVMTLKAWEKRGRLTSQRTERVATDGRICTMYVYDPREVAKIPKRAPIGAANTAPGEVAARAYELFAQGATFREIVVELRETSETVRALHERWLDDGGADLVITQPAKLALEAELGAFASVADLVTLVAGRKAKR